MRTTSTTSYTGIATATSHAGSTTAAGHTAAAGHTCHTSGTGHSGSTLADFLCISAIGAVFTCSATTGYGRGSWDVCDFLGCM